MNGGRMNRRYPRRSVLRGAGEALTLPLIESLRPRPVRAQAAELPRRFLPR
jgi:hypothetical protein